MILLLLPNDSLVSGKNTKTESHQKRGLLKVSLPFSLWQGPYSPGRADLDRIEMALQAREYERRHAQGGVNGIPDLNLQQFFDSSIPKIENAEVKSWATALEQTRQLP